MTIQKQLESLAPTWEPVDKDINTDRMAVPGGWLYLYRGVGIGAAMVFVPWVMRQPEISPTVPAMEGDPD